VTTALRPARPIRFGYIVPSTIDTAALVDAARTAERVGYSTVALNDHLSSTVAPLLGLQAIAATTSTVRVATCVLNQDLRHPAVLAKELATLDLLSGGRLEIGLGAGWVREDYEQSGIPFEPAPARIERLEEVITVLRALFADGPADFTGRHFTIEALDGIPKPTQPGGPPILIGGGGPKLLSMAAARADIVQVLGATLGQTGAVVDDFSSFRTAAYEERVAWVRDAAGTRFDDIELSLHLAYIEITDDAEQAATGFLEQITQAVTRYGGGIRAFELHTNELLESPIVAIGSVDEVCNKLRHVQASLGFAYFVAPYGSPPEALAPVIERLTPVGNHAAPA
jgi:probable F420-dependent oxidoreductase